VASREFYRDGPDGKEDAFLHEPILDNPEAERASIQATRDRLIAAGEDPALIAELYPLD
jgi:hypothetical protein